MPSSLFKSASLFAIPLLVFAISPALGQDSTDVPPDPATPTYVTGAGVFPGPPVIRVYQDSIPWFGENREKATLLALGKVLGTDYFVHPLSDLALGIPSDTAVVLITSKI